MRTVDMPTPTHATNTGEWRRRRWRGLLGIVLAGSLAAAGCGSSDDDAATAAVGNDAGAEAADDVVEGTSTEVISPVEPAEDRATEATATDDGGHSAEAESPSRTEVFEYSSNGVTSRGKIHLPESFERSMNLPTIYLIDFTEQHFEVVLDEFETVIDSTNQIDGLNALVATLEEIPDINASPISFEEHADLFRDMANHIDGRYTDNPSRTFIGKGSEAGIVLLELFSEGPEGAAFDNYVATDAESGYAGAVRNILFSQDFSEATAPRRLHLSFSTSNNVQLLTELADLIGQAEYPWLEFESVYYSDLDYENAYPTAFTDGLRFIFGGESSVSESERATQFLDLFIAEWNARNQDAVFDMVLPDGVFVTTNGTELAGEELVDAWTRFITVISIERTGDAVDNGDGSYSFNVEFSSSKMVLTITLEGNELVSMVEESAVIG